MKHKSAKPYIVLSTIASREEAEKISKALIESNLAACVNIIPNVSSLFFWKGQIDRADELLLLIKTDEAYLTSLEAKIKSLHSYDVPEIIGLQIDWGNTAYLDWLREAIQAKS